MMTRVRRPPDEAVCPGRSRRVAAGEWLQLLELDAAHVLGAGPDYRQAERAANLARDRYIAALMGDGVSASHIADLLGCSRATPYEVRKHVSRGEAGSRAPRPAQRRRKPRPPARVGADAELLRAAWETLHNPGHLRLPAVVAFLQVVEATGCRGADLGRLVGVSPPSARATIRYARTLRERDRASTPSDDPSST